MWKLLKHMSVDMLNKELIILELMLDFEIAVHNAARAVFGNIRIIGCKFHLGQSWFKQISASKYLRLAYSYKGDENKSLVEVKRWLNSFSRYLI